MKTIRLNTFETNSSSQHVMTVTSKEIFDKFLNKELIWDISTYNKDDPEFKTVDQVVEVIHRDCDIIPVNVIKSMVEILFKGNSEARSQLNDIISYFELPDQGYQAHFQTYENMADITDNFTYGDSDITKKGNDVVELNAEWYE